MTQGIFGYPADPTGGSTDIKVVVWEADSSLTNDRVLTPGNNITFSNDGTNLFINAAATGGGAPTTASYVTINTEPSLSEERRLAEGNGITITDNGPNSTVDVGVSSSVLGATFITVSAETILTGERRLIATSPLQTTDNGANSTFVVSIASSTATTVLTASGGTSSFQFGAFIGSVSWSGGGTNTLTAGSESLNSINSTAGTTTFNLPSPDSCQSKLFNFKKTDASINTIVISAGAFTIDGADTYTLYVRYQGVSIYSTGSEWLVF